MSFWAGFFIGVAATYALSAGVVIALIVLQRRTERREKAIIERELARNQPIRWRTPSSVPFTHLTNIGSVVHGRDD